MPIYVDPITTTTATPTGEPRNVIRYVGEPNVPHDVRRHRANNLDTLRRFGTPVLIKKMYTDRDKQEGRAVPSPNFSSVYKQPRHGDPLSHGVGFVGAEGGVMTPSPDEWYDTTGSSTEIVKGASPGVGWAPAPLYRGFGPTFLTYAILPDVAEDVFKLNEAGVLIRVQNARVQMGWYPEVNDNDLLIVAEIDRTERVIRTHERFQLKMTNPISIRGHDRLGRKEYNEDFGNRHVVEQQFEMTLVPKSDVLYNVEVDR